MTIIRDPNTGDGQKVRDTGESLVRANSRTQEHVESHDNGAGYFANTADTADTLTMATGNTYNMLFIKNTHTSKCLVVEKIFPTVDTAGVVMKFIKNMAEGTITNANAHVPANNNFGSGNAAVGTFYNWDEVGTTGITGLSGGTTLSTYILNIGSLPQPIDGAISIPQGKSLTIQLINGTGGAVEGTVNARMYYT